MKRGTYVADKASPDRLTGEWWPVFAGTLLFLVEAANGRIDCCEVILNF
jgi:hypothetical protein